MSLPPSSLTLSHHHPPLPSAPPCWEPDSSPGSDGAGNVTSLLKRGAKSPLHAGSIPSALSCPSLCQGSPGLAQAGDGAIQVCWSIPARAPQGQGMSGDGWASPGLSPRAREVLQIDQFLKETAAREANAKVRLQHFIEELLDRADRAEKQLQIISSSCGTTPNGSLGRCGTPATKGIARAVPLRAQARRGFGNAPGDWGTHLGIGEPVSGFGNAHGDSGMHPGVQEPVRGFGNMSGDLGTSPGIWECTHGFGIAPRGLGTAGDLGTHPGIREWTRGFGNTPMALGMDPLLREHARGFENVPGALGVHLGIGE